MIDSDVPQFKDVLRSIEVVTQAVANPAVSCLDILRKQPPLMKLKTREFIKGQDFSYDSTIENKFQEFNEELNKIPTESVFMHAVSLLESLLQSNFDDFTKYVEKSWILCKIQSKLSHLKALALT